MKKNIAAFALTLGLGSILALPAQASEDLFKKSGCNACHAIDKKVLGPALKDVSAKYKGKKGADAALAAKIKGGSKDVWGVIPMPPNTVVSEENALILAKWVLTQ